MVVWTCAEVANCSPARVVKGVRLVQVVVVIHTSPGHSTQRDVIHRGSMVYKVFIGGGNSDH